MKLSRRLSPSHHISNLIQASCTSPAPPTKPNQLHNKPTLQARKKKEQKLSTRCIQPGQLKKVNIGKATTIFPPFLILGRERVGKEGRGRVH